MSKELQIHIGDSLDEVGRRFVDAWQRAERGELTGANAERHAGFENVEVFARTLTPRRLEMLRRNVADLPNVSVTLFGGLLVDFAREQKADAIIRGLRALSDFEFEFNMALMNRHLQPAIETIFVMPHEPFSYTSSTLVKQVAKYGGDVTHFVPADVAAELKRTFAA